MTATRLRIWTTIVIAVVLIFLLSYGVSTYTDWLWFGSLGFQGVYLISLFSRVAVFFGAAIPFVVIFLGNAILARRLSTRQALYWGQSRVLDRRIFGWLIAIAAFLLGWAVGLAAEPRWMDFLRYVNQAPFGVKDPLYGLDVGFFVFSLPLYHFLQGWLITALLITLAAVLTIYLLSQLPNLQDGRGEILPHVRLHVSALGAALFAVVAWGHRLEAFDLVYSPRGVAFGASYTDVHAELPALQAMFWLALLIAALLLANLRLRRLWLPLIGVGVWLIVGVVAVNLVPDFVQRYSVQPNELAAETPYIQYNIQHTRQAYNLDHADVHDFGQVQPLTARTLADNRPTLLNVRLWDYRPLAETYRQIQEIRLYYRFNDMDIDRYQLDGDYRQVMLSARELDQSQLQSPTWVNQHLQFTHGYGVVMNPVNEVTREGLPELWIKDLPPSISVPLRIDRPEIYFGELTDDYVFVNSGIQEFDYPRGEENVYTSYQGTGGIRLDSYLKRFAFALRLGDINMMLSQYITGDSRLLMIRRIQERAQLVAPFLEYDHDPYLVILDGKLLWIQDAYTTSDRYPYSQPAVDGVNYIRNAVKVVTDAYNGTLTFYVADPSDPLIQTYAAIFPGLFQPQSAMPAGLSQHLRYPEDLFRLQAMMYQTYHMTDVNVFYNKEDQWNIPRDTVGQQDMAVEPYYVIIRLPDGTREEFMLIQPFTPATKDNLVAWMAGRCDAPNYGQLVVYRFSKNELVFGPSQIEARINQDPDISAQLTLWGQHGSQVIRGNLLAIPMEHSLLYIEPLYLQSESGQIPELKRVILASGERVVMSETLAGGLAGLFGPEAGTVAGLEAAPPSAAQPPPPAAAQPQPPAAAANLTPDLARQVNELARQADAHYTAAQAALKNGDWAAYGAELDAAQKAVKQLVEITGGVAGQGQ